MKWYNKSRQCVNDKIEITNFDYEKITDLGSY